MLDNAKFIAHKINLENYACPVFKREFSLDKEIKSAYLEITSLGTYYAEINGARVGDFIFAPGWTSLKRVQAQKYDITAMLVNIFCQDSRIRMNIQMGCSREIAHKLYQAIPKIFPKRMDWAKVLIH